MHRPPRCKRTTLHTQKRGVGDVAVSTDHSWNGTAEKCVDSEQRGSGGRGKVQISIAVALPSHDTCG
jgi:hypothetical protein